MSNPSQEEPVIGLPGETTIKSDEKTETENTVTRSTFIPMTSPIPTPTIGLPEEVVPKPTVIQPNTQQVTPSMVAGYKPTPEIFVPKEKPYVPKPETFVPTDKRIREEELKRGIEFSERVDSGEFDRIAAEQGAPQMPYFDTQYKESVKDIKQKYQVIQDIKQAEQSYQNAGIEIPPEVQKQISDAKALVYGKASPFVNLATGQVDLITAVKAGVTTSELQDIGINEFTIKQAKAYIKIQDKYDGDIVKALDGDIEAAKALYGEEETVRLQQEIKQLGKENIDIRLSDTKLGVRMGGRPITEIEDYAFGNGYDLTKYLFDNSDNLESGVQYLRSMGFKEDDISEALRTLKEPYYQKTELEKLYRDARNLGYLPEPKSLEEIASDVIYTITRQDGTTEQYTYKQLYLDKSVQLTSFDSNGKYNPIVNQKITTGLRDYESIGGYPIGFYVKDSTPSKFINKLASAVDDIYITEVKTGVKPELSAINFVNLFLNARGITTDSPGYYIYKKMGEQLYKKLYGSKTYEESKLVDVSTLLFVPSRAAQPDVTLKDITGMEWAVGGAQLVTYALPFVGGALGTGLSTVAGGIFAANTAKNWSKLSTPEKALSVVIDSLFFIPIVKSAFSAVKLSTVKVPTTKGEVTVWRGLDINGNPIIGVSNKRVVFGSGSNLTQVLDVSGGVSREGFKPITAIETKILTNPKTLEKLGFTTEDIAKIQTTLKQTAKFAGKKSPYLTKKPDIEPIKALDENGVKDVLTHAVEYGDDVEMVYGSSTIKMQLRPDLRTWRKPADIDIQLKLSETEAAEFAKKLVDKLQKTMGKENVRVSSDSPTLVETFRDGEWHHAVDIHAKGEIPIGISDSVDPAAGYGYVGNKLTEPAIEIEYPNIGKVRIMRLSETGKRKAIAILKWQNLEKYKAELVKLGKTTEEIEKMVGELRNEIIVSPQAHRLKDIVDYYVILKTFNGDDAANAWAKAYGYNPDDLLAEALKSPPELQSWVFMPKGTYKPSNITSPAIRITPPSYLTTGIVSPALSKVISMPVNLSVPIVTSGSLPIISKPVSVSSVKSPSLGKVSPSLGTSVKLSPSISKSESISMRSIPKSEMISLPNETSTGLSAPVSKPVSKSVSVPISVPASTPVSKPVSKPISPSIPSASITISPPTGVKVTPPYIPDKGKIARMPDSSKPPSVLMDGGYSAIGWKQGALKRGNELKRQYIIIRSPYKSEKDVQYVYGKPPKNVKIVDGIGSAYKSIKAITGKPPDFILTLDMGIQDVKISSKGKKIKLKFKRDVKQKTTSDINLAKVRT